MATTTNTDPNGPSYYKRGSEDVWDFIRDQGLNFHLGNAIKYICRAGYKDSKIQDLEKAIHYLENELTHEKDLYFRASQGVPYRVQLGEQPCETKEFPPEGSDG
tara:strand:- start:59 stop:370 length:312 start_codon:yes stop_codon:yes gene_type:complete